MPDEEKFGLTSQIRRASVSVTSNIVEGSERGSSKELSRFLLITRATLAEVQSQLLIARDLGYISNEAFEQLADKSVEVNKLINGYKKGVARNS